MIDLNTGITKRRKKSLTSQDASTSTPVLHDISNVMPTPPQGSRFSHTQEPAHSSKEKSVIKPPTPLPDKRLMAQQLNKHIIQTIYYHVLRAYCELAAKEVSNETDDGSRVSK